MFGFLKVPINSDRNCQSSSNGIRQNYCGTCKAIGVEYGHTIRFVLNSDIAFLGYLFESLIDDDHTKKITPFDCLSLPQPKDIPFHLEYLATINTILAKLKIEDKIVDGNVLWAKALKNAYANTFDKATKKLQQWNFPTDQLLLLTQNQQEVEKTVIESNSIATIVEYYGEQTAKITELCLVHGGKLLGLSTHEIESLGKLGKKYGELIYLVDAVEDFEKDKQNNHFNPFLKSFGYSQELLPVRTAIHEYICLQRKDILSIINGLNIPDSNKTLLINHFQEGFKRFETKLLDTSPERKLTWKERVTFAKNRVRIAQEELQCSPERNQVSWFKIGVVSSIVYFVALIEPKTPAANYTQASMWGCASEVWGCICLIIGVGCLYNLCCSKN